MPMLVTESCYFLEERHEGISSIALFRSPMGVSCPWVPQLLSVVTVPRG